jgi:phosphate transport system substrate-binding protein
MRAKFKSTAAAAVMMAGLLAAGAASAITVGGGATLPESLYDAILPSGVGLTTFTYTGTGSGAGKTAFFNNDATGFDNESLSPAPTPALPLPHPWPATQSVHFAGSDSQLTAAELVSYNTAHLSTWGPLIQIPSVATSVLIPYKRAGISNLDLSDAQMCHVFSNTTGGQTWGQLRGTTDTTQVKVTYRTDGSGTTEMLSRYLVQACPGAGFVVSNTFTTVVAGAVAGGIIPSHWVGVTGSGGMAAIFTSPASQGNVGYLSPDPTYTGSNNAVVAKVNGTLPIASAIQTTLAGQSLPAGGASSNPLAWVPTYTKPALTSYPIFGATNLLLNQCYKDATATANVRAFVAALTGTTDDLQITNHNFIVIPHGPAPLNDWKTAIANTFLTSTSSLAIGNTSVCNGRGRPLNN